ncbi:hypothetical protein [Marinactinospora rubrisoli]|uniref:Uncharacterized protein n=1 Tax=Marinactinospora rubrisoli TaxID=2715399 RepID=A0ABW2KE53_9ACTN
MTTSTHRTAATGAVAAPSSRAAATARRLRGPQARKDALVATSGDATAPATDRITTGERWSAVPDAAAVARLLAGHTTIVIVPGHGGADAVDTAMRFAFGRITPRERPADLPDARAEGLS